MSEPKRRPQNGQKKPNKTNFSLIGWQNNEIRLQTLNSTRNWQKNAEITKFSNFWAICVRKRIFQEFFLIPDVWAPIPAVFPLFSRCSGPIPAVFPLFSRYFPAVFRALWCFQGFAVKLHKKNQNLKSFVQNSGFAAKTNKKTKYPKILSKTVVLRPKRTKKQNFQIFTQTRSKQTRKTNFSEILPKTGQNGQKDKIFRNLALKRLKRTKKHISLNLCAKQCVCSQNTQTKPNFQKSWPEQRFAVKACKINLFFGIKALNCPKQNFMF